MNDDNSSDDDGDNNIRQPLIQDWQSSRYHASDKSAIYSHYMILAYFGYH